tara:strand:- start:435 stop:1412 length:978 start_codon:yes stop_codon:yes gene_type:complete
MGNFCGEASEDKGQTMKEAPGNEGIRQFEEQRVRQQPTGGNTFTTNLVAKESSDPRGMSPGEETAITNMSPSQRAAINQRMQSNTQYNPNRLGSLDLSNYQGTRNPKEQTFELQKEIADMNPFLRGIHNLAAKFMDYERDDKGQITPTGLAMMKEATAKTVAADNARQEDRQKDIDRANMRTNIQGVGTPLDPCPEGYVYNEESQKCEPVEEQTDNMTFTKNPMGLQNYMNQFATEGQGNVPLTRYGRVGGEYDFFMNQGGPPRGPQGEITGAGGPKDDLVGPFMLSNKEYVLPNEQIKMYGGGNYETGVKRLERDRKNALKNNK